MCVGNTDGPVRQFLDESAQVPDAVAGIQQQRLFLPLQQVEIFRTLHEADDPGLFIQLPRHVVAEDHLQRRSLIVHFTFSFQQWISKGIAGRPALL